MFKFAVIALTVAVASLTNVKEASAQPYYGGKSNAVNFGFGVKNTSYNGYNSGPFGPSGYNGQSNAMNFNLGIKNNAWNNGPGGFNSQSNSVNLGLGIQNSSVNGFNNGPFGPSGFNSQSNSVNFNIGIKNSQFGWKP